MIPSRIVLSQFLFNGFLLLLMFISAVFQAFDEQSGLNYVHWKLFDNFTSVEEWQENGTIPVVKPDKVIFISNIFKMKKETKQTNK